MILTSHNRLTDLDFNVMDLLGHKKLLALIGNGETIFPRESVRLDADPDNDWGDGLFSETNANGIYTRQLHLLGVQDVEDLNDEVIVPDLLQEVVADWAKLLIPEVSLWACGWLPSIVHCASHKDWPGGKSMVVVLGLEIGGRQERSSGSALRRGHVRDREKRSSGALRRG